MHFSKKSGRLSSAGPEILVFGSHCSAKFQPILDCFAPNLKLKYEDSENIKKIEIAWYSSFQITSNQTEKVFFRTLGTCNVLLLSFLVRSNGPTLQTPVYQVFNHTNRPSKRDILIDYVPKIFYRLHTVSLCKFMFCAPVKVWVAAHLRDRHLPFTKCTVLS